MKKWRIPVSWEMAGIVEVEADTLEEAIEIAEDERGEIPLPDNGEYVMASWRTEVEDVEACRDLYNDGQKDDAKIMHAYKVRFITMCGKADETELNASVSNPDDEIREIFDLIETLKEELQVGKILGVEFSHEEEV